MGKGERTAAEPASGLGRTGRKVKVGKYADQAGKASLESEQPSPTLEPMNAAQPQNSVSHESGNDVGSHVRAPEE